MSTAVQQASTQSVATESQLAVSYSVCRGITRSAATNFYYAFLVLPKRKRQALNAVYAFMRRCDDIADEAGVPVPERRQKLDLWLNAFHRAQAGQPTDDPVLLALTDAQRRHGIPPELLDRLAYGTAMTSRTTSMKAWDQARSGALHMFTIRLLRIFVVTAITLRPSWVWSAFVCSVIGMPQPNRLPSIVEWLSSSLTSFVM